MASVLGQHLRSFLLPIWEFLRNTNTVIHNSIFIKSKKIMEGGHGTYSVGTWVYQVWRLWKQQRKALTWPLGLVAQAGMSSYLSSWTVHLALLAIKPGLTGLCPCLHNTTAPICNITRILYFYVYIYVIVPGSAETQRGFLSFSIFLNETEKLSSSLSNQLLAKTWR